jgi:hypothetical protein
MQKAEDVFPPLVAERARRVVAPIYVPHLGISNFPRWSDAPSLFPGWEGSRSSLSTLRTKPFRTRLEGK